MDKPTPVHNSFRIRFAQEADISAILGFIHALADYEHMSDQVIADDALLREWIFEKKKAEVLIGEEREGFRSAWPSFSTIFPPSWGARASIWRTCLSCRKSAEMAMAKPCWSASRPSPLHVAAAGVWNGAALTGTSQASIFTGPWARCP